MSAYVDAMTAREFEARNTPEGRVALNRCPVRTCLGDLDTGGECNECGHDALPLLLKIEGLSA